MQKAIVVRVAVEGSDAVGRSFEVDPCSGAPAQPLRRLLAAGWQVAQVHPIPNESACLLILDRSPAAERPTSRHELTLVDMNHPAPGLTPSSGRKPRTASPLPSAGRAKPSASEWDETIPLGVFRLDPGHGERREEGRGNREQ